ncbi:MAG: Gfo/Idh/MocA family oxidoreductase [Planctomycetota bacterium]
MDRVRLAVVGVGIWGRMHVRAYAQHPSAELVAVCDLDEARVNEVGETWGVPGRYTSLDALLESEEIDGVSVATPDNAHTDVVIRCADAGKHVLCEKPMARTVEECERMIEAAERNEVMLMIDWHNRWNPPVCAAWRSVRDGELGDLRYVYYRLSDTVYVPLKMLTWADRSNALLFLGSHAIDTICWLMQKDVRRVTCRRREGVLREMGVDTPDLFLTVLDFDDGAVAVVENSWLLPQSSASLIDHKVELLGSKGAIYVDPTHSRALTKYTELTPLGYPNPSYPDMFVSPEVHGRQLGLAVESINHFVECVRDGEQPLATGQDGLLNTRLINAAEESAANDGAPVELA